MQINIKTSGENQAIVTQLTTPVRDKIAISCM